MSGTAPGRDGRTGPDEDDVENGDGVSEVEDVEHVEEVEEVEDDVEGSGYVPGRARQRVGIITGKILVVLAALAVVALAALGFRPALYLIVLLVAGVVLIVGGGKIHRM